MKCPECGSLNVYARQKTEDIVCTKCGEVNKMEGKIMQVPVYLNDQDIQKMIIENNRMLQELLKIAKE